MILSLTRHLRASRVLDSTESIRCRDSLQQKLVRRLPLASAGIVEPPRRPYQRTGLKAWSLSATGRQAHTAGCPASVADLARGLTADRPAGIISFPELAPDRLSRQVDAWLGATWIRKTEICPCRKTEWPIP